MNGNWLRIRGDLLDLNKFSIISKEDRFVIFFGIKGVSNHRFDMGDSAGAKEMLDWIYSKLGSTDIINDSGATELAQQTQP